MRCFAQENKFDVLKLKTKLARKVDLGGSKHSQRGRFCDETHAKYAESHVLKFFDMPREDGFESVREQWDEAAMPALSGRLYRGSASFRLGAFRSHLSIMLSEVRHCADCASVRRGDKVHLRKMHPLANNVGRACGALYELYEIRRCV